ncbi:MAG: UvrD-helicase domain-containing protein [Proteobacteria bacterium]|nr:UvrD-helicase domain-containing protein [Pseudomonadota bacterium]
MITPADQLNRDRIISEVDQTISVFAGAGTGKTTLLTRRYLSLLQQKQVSPKQIVAITFTIKAAAELRERILLGLQRENMQHLTAAVETSPIGTIHSFCANILRQFALEANLDPQFAVISELEHRTFLNEVFQSWFTQSLATHAHIFKKTRAAEISFSKIRQLASRLYDYRDLLPRISIQATSISSQDFERLTSEVKDLYQFALHKCSDQEDKGFSSIHHFHQTLLSLETEPLDFQIESLMREKLPKAPGVQKNWASAQDCKDFKANYEVMRENFIKIQQAYAKNLFLDLIEWVKGYVDQVELEKQNRSLLDFTDLLLLTRDLLRKNPSVREQLQQQFQYFLIDEFQDTDPMQAEIFWTLARDENRFDSKKSWHDQPLIKGKLFTVGDMNQSIYRFRDASVETYQKAVESIQTQGELLDILHNFRSHPGIIHTVNNFFTQILPDHFKPLLTHEALISEPAVHMLEMKESKDRKDESRALEAHCIAAHIRNLIDTQMLIQDPKTKVERPVQYKDIAILFPAIKTSLGIYQTTLREHGIPFVAYKAGSFFEAPEIHSVVLTLASLLYPFDKLAVPAALSSAWFGCSLDDLATIKKQFNTFDYREMETNLPDQVQQQIQILRTLHKDILKLSPVQFMDSFLTQTNAMKHAELGVNTSQVKENLRKFSWLAHDFETNHSRNIGEFYEWVSHLSEQSRDTTEATPSDESNSTQMMTIHTSKGLEFPIVFLANFVSRIQESAPVYANRFDQKLEIRIGDKDTFYRTEGFDELAEKEKDLMMEEKKRLLYVAMTRARDIIVVPSTLDSDGYQELLEPLMEQVQNFKAFDYTKSEIKKPSRTLIDPKEPKFIETSFLMNIPQGYKRTTATEEKEGSVVRSENKYPFIQRPKLGIAFHAYVEYSNQPSIQQHLIDQITFEHGIENQKDELTKLVTTYLSSDLHHRIQTSKQVLKEVPFSYFQDEILYEGYIDLLFEESDGWVIVDLKTDQITDQQLAERSKVYRAQLDIYGSALKRTGLTIKDKILYFVRLNQAHS